MEYIEIIERQAIDSAIRSDWETAISINKKILEDDPNNLPALLRLGFAYFRMSNLLNAKKTYNKALRIQPTNSVARENLEKIQILSLRKTKKNSKTIRSHFDPNLFLEISGKTRTFNLINLGQKNILAQLSIGEEVFLRSKKRRVEVRTKDKEYIGSLPDDISRRLSFFMKAKSEYSCFIKEVSLNRVTVFIREEKKSKKVSRYISFPQNISLNPSHLRYDEDTEEENELLEEVDIEKLAEKLANEEKEYLPYKSTDDEEEEE